MKKKFLAVLMAATLAMSLMACGSDEPTDSNDDASVEQNDSTENVDNNSNVEEETKNEDDGIINFEAESYTVTYTRHELGTDWDGNPCLFYYYNFTNNGEEATSAMTTSYIQCFQNGIECETALVDYNAEMDNYLKEIQPGVTLEVCTAFALTDNSEVTLEASDWLSFSNDKDVQKITLE